MMEQVNKKLEGLKDFKNSVRCIFSEKPSCYWVKKSGLCGYPPTGPHLFDGVCHTYSHIKNLECPECAITLVCSDTEEHGQKPYCPKCNKIIP